MVLRSIERCTVHVRQITSGSVPSTACCRQSWLKLRPRSSDHILLQPVRMHMYDFTISIVQTDDRMLLLPESRRSALHFDVIGYAEGVQI